MTDAHDNQQPSTASGDETSSRRQLLASLASAGVGAAVFAAIAEGQVQRPLATPTVSSTVFPPATSRYSLLEIQRYLDARLPDTEQQSILSEIGRPIDMGADKLLERYVLARLNHAPNQLEYLLQTLADHVKQCVEIRRQAQDLEEKVTATAIGLEFDRRAVDLLGEQLKLFGNRGDRVLSNTIDAKFDTAAGAIVSSESGMKIAGEIARLSEAFVQAQKNSVENRAAHFRQAGSGANLIQRHRFLQGLFDLELVEAYQRARAVGAGLWSLHRIDLPVPPLKSVGYLDDLALWTRTAYYQYEARVMKREVVTVYLPLRKIAELADVGLMEEAQWTAARGIGSFGVTLTPSQLEFVAPGLKNPLIVGLALGLDGKTKDQDFLAPAMARVTLPKTVFRDKAGAEVAAIDLSAHIPTFPITELSSASVAQPRTFRNVSPIGRWTIELAKAKTSGISLRSNDASLVNVILVLSISHEVA